MSKLTLCVVLLLAVSAQHASAQDAPSNRLLLKRALTPLTFDVTGAAMNGLRLGQTQQSQTQQPNSPRRNGWKWGLGIGAAAGFAGGLAQPTHSNGEYVLGSSRGASAAALAGISAGIGGAIGWAIDRAR